MTKSAETQNFILSSTIEELADMLEAMPLTQDDDRPNRRLALELADRLTFEQGQELYRFAVLVTKLI